MSNVMCITKMSDFAKRLDALKRESDQYFCASFESEEAETEENVRIKTGLLELIKEASECGNDPFADEARLNVIKYLCEVCGHSGDLEILRNHTPDILSPEELEYIIQNSALSRWF